ncbi:MAG: hypothetical protein TEF_04260 [Rhizobiales bacterium NRL2]|nr:MAG: hypothetical protein TEF_04260 [Rhizobiales bacterium NRL2]
MSDEHVKINDTEPRIAHLGDDAATVFAAPFPYLAAADLAVWAGGLLQTIEADYTVAGAGESGGGSVTFAVAPAAGVEIVIARRTAIERVSDFLPGGALRADVLNTELDRLTAIAQELRGRLDRALRLADHDAAPALAAAPAKTALANRLLAFDGDGEPVAGPLSASLQQVENAAALEASAAASAASAEASAASAQEDANGVAALVQNVPAASSFSGDGTGTDFALAAAPVSHLALIVVVDGAVIDPQDYSVDGATLSFAAAPADGSAILVRDLSATAAVDAAAVAALAPLAAEIEAVGQAVGAVAQVAAELEAVGEAAQVAARADLLRRHPSTPPPALVLAPSIGHGTGLLTCERDGAATTAGPARRLTTVAADAARLWHDPQSGRPLYILKEEAATNLCLQSADLAAAPWIDSGAPTTGIGATAPDGGPSTRVTDAEAGVSSSRRQFIDLSGFQAGAVLTVSAWIRRSDPGVFPALRVFVFDDALPVRNKLFDAALLPFSTAELTNLTGAWDDHGFEHWADGWVRCRGRIVLPDPGAQALDYMDVRAFPAWNAQDLGSADAAAEGFADFFGYQVEAGGRASSYIPTVAAQVTRPADALQAALPHPPVASEFTLLARYRYLGPDGAGGDHAHPLSLGDATDGADAYLAFRHGHAGGAAAEKPGAVIETPGGGLDSLGQASARVAGLSVAVAATVDGAGSVFEVDGEGDPATATPAQPDPARLTHLIVGAEPTLAWDTHHNIGLEEAALWPVRLSDAQLTEITA